MYRYIHIYIYIYIYIYVYIYTQVNQPPHQTQATDALSVSVARDFYILTDTRTGGAAADVPQVHTERTSDALS